MAKPTLILLDGHSLAYRAFFALPDTLATQSGTVTNAAFGFTSMLVKLLTDRDPDGIAVSFDVGRDVARTEAYPEYKAGRAKMPDLFRPQIGFIEEVLDALNIPVVTAKGIEADDVLATLATQAVDDGMHAYIVTGDRDGMQIVSDDITLLYNLRGITEVGEMTPTSVHEKYGVTPEQYLHYAALRGDKSDNLPGVPGVGEKTAAKLINEYGDIDNIYLHIDDISGKKVPQALRDHEEQVRINVALMRLRTDIALDVKPGDLTRVAPDMDKVRDVFGRYEFRNLLDRYIADVLGEAPAVDAPSIDAEPRKLAGGELGDAIDAIDGPVTVIAALSGTTGTPVWDAVALAGAGVDPVVLAAADATDGDRATLRDLLSGERELVTHEAKALHRLAMLLDSRLNNLLDDTELSGYLVSPEQRTFDLARLAEQHLGRALPALPDDTDEALAPLLDTALEAHTARAVHALIAGELDERGQTDLLSDIELPLAGVLARMESVGIAVDTDVLDELRGELTGRAAELEASIHEHAGREFKVGSTKQLQEVLFDELGLTKTKKIKTGWSTDATQMGKIADEHPIVEEVLSWREVSKLLSTYVDALPNLIDPGTGRIHTTLSQTVAATGRLSSANPNLQNIPVRNPDGKRIRRAFVPGEGYDVLLVADYSQIELRIMAHLSGDAGLLDAFKSGEDIHATTASAVFDTPLEEVDGPLRDRAKAVNYGLAYGLTSYGLSQQLDIAVEEAEEIIDTYMERFPGIADFLGQAVDDARRDGYTTTMFGRRRYLPDLRASNRMRREMAERMALNAPIQGTAADIIKLAMIRLDEALAGTGVKSRQLLQVHDEVILECPADELDQVRELVVSALEGVADLDVDLDVDTAHGPNWYEAEKHA